MAEEFLETIYEQADVLQRLHETVKAARTYMLERAFVRWNGLTATLMQLAKDTAETDMKAAVKLMNAAEAVSGKWGDPILFASEIERELIPAYLECMKYKACIDVEDGRYRLVSADSGYLTVYDKENELWLHDNHDPMEAAADLAAVVYKPGMEEFHLFGCGLGYEAYQIWLLSEKSVKIFIYETDSRMVSLAFSYGVLDRIDEDLLVIIEEDDPRRLKEFFVKNSADNDTGSYISFWEAAEYKKFDGGELVQSRMISDGERSFERLWAINAVKNIKRANISFEQLRESISSDEWIVVAAGPSLDEKIDFLKQAAGNKRIVTVETVLRKLFTAGIRPDVVTAADPKEAIIRYLKGIEEETADIPLIAGTLTGWKYTQLYKGDVCLITEGINSLKYTAEAESGEIWDIGGTVSALAIEAAVRLGAKKVYVVGLDLSYPDGKFYANDCDNDNTGKGDSEVWVRANNGGRVRSSVTFKFFIEQIEKQISRYPDVAFINLSEKGAEIKGMKTDADFY